MSTFDPSHNPLRKPAGRHAQAVYDPSAVQDVSDSDSDESQGERRARKEGRRRVRAAMPPLPDQRFEQSYLMSLRPFITPAPVPEEDEGVESDDQKRTKSMIVSAEDDAVYKWGRNVQVDWRMVIYVTLRDQVFFPMISGAMWGWGTLFIASTAAGMRKNLYPTSHINRGKITGGPGGTIEKAGGGEAVGGGWWQKFVGSWTGAVQTATV